MVSLSGISTGSASASTYASARSTSASGAQGAATGSTSTGKDLTQDQQAQVRDLQKTDTQVKAHEQAHKAAGGSYAGGIQYDYTTGPDGRRYATGGEVPIDTSPVRGNPDATIAKMEVVKRAALAPQDPSPQDRAVAAKADAAKAQAQNERNAGDGGDGGSASDAQGASANQQQDASGGDNNAQSGAADIALYRQAAKNYSRADNNARSSLSLSA